MRRCGGRSATESSAGVELWRESSRGARRERWSTVTVPGSVAGWVVASIHDPGYRQWMHENRRVTRSEIATSLRLISTSPGRLIFLGLAGLCFPRLGTGARIFALGMSGRSSPVGGLDRTFDRDRSSIWRDRRLRAHRQPGGECPPPRACASWAVRPAVPVGGAMPAGTDRTRRWDCRPRQRSPRGGGATGRCSGGGQDSGGGGARYA